MVSVTEVTIPEVRVLLRATRPGFPTGRIVPTSHGEVFCRVVTQDSTAPTVLLVHGWSAWCDANWLPVYQPLLDAGWNLIAPDLPGHADGARVERFSLVEAADICAEVCTQLGARRVVACGYSMGGPVAMLLRDRHPGLVDGLVLVATSAWFHGSIRDEALFGAARAGLRVAPLLPAWLFTKLVGSVLGGARKAGELWRWMIDDVTGHHWPTVLDAALDLARFDFRDRDLAVGPAAVVMTEADSTVPATRQDQLARAVDAQALIRLDADHSAPVSASARFASAVVEALSVVVPSPMAT